MLKGILMNTEMVKAILAGRKTVTRRLYVRETWCKGSLNGGAEQYFYRADEKEFYCSWHPSIHMPKEAARIFLRVTEVKVERLQEITVEGTLQEGIDTEVPPICESSINGNIPNDNQRALMDKMSEKEREEYIQDLARHTYMGWCDYADKLFRIYNQLWNSTIKKSDIDKYGWNANPWVWVIEFERISKEEALKNA